METRRLPIRMRAKQDEDPEAPAGVLVGYASVYEVEYRTGWGLKESITRGAFDESIKEQGGVLPIFYEHDWLTPIGFASAGSDKKGVKVEASLFLDEVERSRSVWLAAKAGALREWSIGYIPTAIRLEKDSTDDEFEVEHIDKGDLVEASVVVRGANPSTEMVSVRAAAEVAAAVARAAAEVAAEPTIPDFLLARLDEEHVRAIVRSLLQDARRAS